MAGKRKQLRADRHKELIRAFEDFCGHGRHWSGGAWSDLMALCAISLVNSVDAIRRKDREKMYQSISGSYTAEELRAVPTFFSLLVEELEENPDQDLLGEMYMNLKLGKERAGQFFTPYCVSAMMAKMQRPAESPNTRDWIAVSDPCCGAGGMLIAFANACLAEGINYQTRVLFVAQDIDFTAACMCYIQLSLLGCAGYVAVGDSLTEPLTCLDEKGLIPSPHANVWILPMYCRMEWSKRVTQELIRLQEKETKVDEP